MVRLFDDELAVVLAKTNPLADHKSISIDELKSEKFIIPGKKSAHYKLILKACAIHDFEPNIIYMSTRLNSMMDFIDNGFGITLMMKRLAESLKRDNTVIVPLLEKVSNPIVMAREKGNEEPKVAKLLWNFMEQKSEIQSSNK
jgi:LysR family transcriptional activator of glutamate synthase operon